MKCQTTQQCAFSPSARRESIFLICQQYCCITHSRMLLFGMLHQTESYNLRRYHGFDKKIDVTPINSPSPPPPQQIKRTNNFSTIVSWHRVHNFWVFGDGSAMKTTSCLYCPSNLPRDWMNQHDSNLRNHRCYISGWEGSGVNNSPPPALCLVLGNIKYICS